MASRRKGGLSLGNAIELEQRLPLDARTMVRTKEEMLDPESFAYGYNGMVVACREDHKLYMLIDQTNPTLEASWIVIAPSEGGGAADSVEWDNVQNKPTFATVATSGSYNDLSDKPTIPEAYDDTALAARVTAVESGKANTADLSPVATSGSYNDLGDKPTIPEAYDDTEVRNLIAAKANSADLAPVATSGSYNDLGDKPTIPEAYDDTALAGRVTAVETALPGKADSSSLATVATSGSYNDLTDKPTIPEDVNVEHFHTVTVLPDPSQAKENHEYVLVTYEQDGVTIATEEHYLFYDGVFHSRPTSISLEGYATEQYVDNAIPTIDSAMSDTSENPVQNKVVLAAIGDAVDVVDTAVQGLDTRVTAVETALNLTALTDEEIAALVPA